MRRDLLFSSPPPSLPGPNEWQQNPSLLLDFFSNPAAVHRLFSTINSFENLIAYGWNKILSEKIIFRGNRTTACSAFLHNIVCNKCILFDEKCLQTAVDSLPFANKAYSLILSQIRRLVIICEVNYASVECTLLSFSITISPSQENKHYFYDIV